MHYADQWLKRDRRFCEILPDPAARLYILSETLKFYGVARCWCKRHKDDDETRFQPLLDIFDSVSTTAAKPLGRTQVVKMVITQLQPHTKNEVLSLATKTLWVWFKEPFIIYDGNAAKALGFPYPLSHRDSAAYYARWEAAFARAMPDILNACSRLPAQHSWLKHGAKITELELRHLADESFFHKRVFDVFLWSCAERNLPNTYLSAV